jgi:hypothetical protein
MFEYIKAHPQLVVLALSILLALVKPRSPEQYAAMNPHLAAALKLAAAILPDLVKAVQVAPQVVAGTPDPTKIPVVVAEEEPK